MAEKRHELGGYSFVFPDWWGYTQVKRAPNLELLQSVAFGPTTFEVVVVPGQGGDAQRDDFLVQSRRQYSPREEKQGQIELAGVLFKALRFVRPRGMGGKAAAVEVFAGAANGDLLAFVLSFHEERDELERVRGHAMKVIEAALQSKR